MVQPCVASDAGCVEKGIITPEAVTEAVDVALAVPTDAHVNFLTPSEAGPRICAVPSGV